MRGGSKLFVLLFFIALPVILLSQSTAVYTFQKDDTLLKRKYLNEALLKKDYFISSVKKEDIKEFKQAYQNMFSGVEELLISSRTVTEEKANSYIKSVAAKIINANPELKSLAVRIVFTRDFPPNAYSMGEGTIAFNAGLFVYLNNEAELAFVLSHELAHYYLEHSKKKIEKLIKVINSDSLKNEFKLLSKQEYRIGEQLEKLYKSLVFDIKRHSREGEAEADRVGLSFLKNSGYSGNGFITSMQLLDNIDDTTLFKPLNLQKLLSFPDYPFREKWIKKESSIFSEMNSEDDSPLTKKERDSLKTHPDCPKRIALLQDAALAIPGAKFLVDESYFRELQKDFIPELVEEVYNSGNISYNLYLSLQMLQESKNLPLAIYSIARDLNLIYKNQKEHKLGIITDSENKSYNEQYNLLIRMIYKLKLDEIAELNERFCSFYQEQMKDYDLFAVEFQKAKKNKQAHQ